MSLIDLCQGYYKLENANAEIGNPFVDTGVTYQALKYNNGAFSANQNYHLTVANAVADMNAWAIGIWVKTNAWTIVNGHASIEWQTFFIWYKNNSNRLYLYTGTPFTGWEGNIGGAGVGFYDKSGINISASVPTYFLFIMNRAGIAGGSHTIRMYIGDSLLYSSTAAIPNIADSTGAFRLLMFNYSSVVPFPFKGGQDECKIWKAEATTSQANIDAIIANRGVEGFPISNTFKRGPVNYINNFPFNRPFARVA